MNFCFDFYYYEYIKQKTLEAACGGCPSWECLIKFLDTSEKILQTFLFYFFICKEILNSGPLFLADYIIVLYQVCKVCISIGKLHL